MLQYPPHLDRTANKAVLKDKGFEYQMFNVEGALWLENNNFSTITAKIGLGRNHQLKLKQRGSFDGDQNIYIVLKVSHHRLLI